MVERKNLLSIGFYKKSPYTGSDGKMCFRIEKSTVVTREASEDTPEETEDRLQATVWRGPYAFAHTTEEKTTHQEEFSPDGIDKICEWLNEESAIFNMDAQ